MKIIQYILSISFFITFVNESYSQNKLNILLITADDLNCNTVGVYGSKVDNITPNIDKLASQGLRFTKAHVNVAVCAPSRGVIATGLYAHNSGLVGFSDTKKDIPTIVKTFKSEGYRCGILGKVDHSSPKFDTPWDTKLDLKDLGMGRDKDIYYKEATKFIQESKKKNQPFYLMVNSHDPHRPFAKSDQEKKWKKYNIKDPSRIYKPNEVVVPGFLPELPEVRLEISEYYSSVRRLDDTVGRILQTLEEQGVANNTLIMFLSDNGMAFPFSKANCYLQSTNTPWLVKWPGVVKEGKVDDEHFISTVDFFPTVLEAAGIKKPITLDGKSFVKILNGKNQKGRKHVFTQFHETNGGNAYPIRSVQDERFGYIFNAWANGKKVFKNESQSGRSWKAMKKVANSDTTIKARVHLFENRVLEEFYDFKNDPNALNNLIHNPKYKKEIACKRKELEKYMEKTGDFLLAAFRKRDDAQFIKKFVAKLQQEAKASKIERDKMKKAKK
ncbi:sulfatase [Polaribacter sp.]|uniref:sulfatase family protein n=1 Tax=Polaribacter sp. TaxID=1920175 RepID=UPI0025DE0865|nr:sulfatase [Polaribacter sp.]